MRLPVTVLLTVLSSCSFTAAVKTHRTRDDQRVIELLKGIQRTILQEGDVEAGQFKRYQQFCDKTESDKKYNIGKAAEKIKALSLELGALDAAIKDQTTARTAAQAKIDSLGADIVSSNKTRQKEYADYLVKAKDLDKAISALQNATKAMSNASKHLKGSVSLPEVSSTANLVFDTMSRVSLLGLSTSSIRHLASLARPGDKADYKYKSGDVIKLLKDLSLTFKENKAEMDRAETEAQNQFALRIQGLTNEKSLNNQEKDTAASIISEKQARLSAAQLEKASEQKVQDSDATFLEQLKADCQDKSKQWTKRQAARQGELDALKKAIDSLTSGFNRFSALQTNRFHSFLQLRRGENEVMSVSDRISELAEEFDDSRLALLSIRLRSAKSENAQPNMTGLILGLIDKLRKEDDEATKKQQYCNTTISKLVSDQAAEKHKLETFSALAEKATGNRATKLKQSVQLENEIVKAMSQLQEATILRAKEKAENEISNAKASEGIAACSYAIDTLKSYYSSLSLAQVEASPNASVSALAPPSDFTSNYGGHQGGVIGEVQRLKDDLDQQIKTTTAQETKAESDYQKLKADTTASNAAKTSAIETLRSDADSLQSSVLKSLDDKATSQKTIDISSKEITNIKDTCDPFAASFLEKRKQRQKQISDLQSVLSTLK